MSVRTCRIDPIAASPEIDVAQHSKPAQACDREADEHHSRAHVLGAPGQLVLVFMENDASGATLGYYGTVVAVETASVDKHPGQPERWAYRVYLPSLNADYRIKARHLIATDEFDPVENLGPRCELHFDGPPGSDNLSISGRYRLAGCATWSAFAFEKSLAASPTFQLSRPVRPPDAPCSLHFSVPPDTELDRDYVIRALGEVFCGSKWTDL